MYRLYGVLLVLHTRCVFRFFVCFCCASDGYMYLCFSVSLVCTCVRVCVCVCECWFLSGGHVSSLYCAC